MEKKGINDISNMSYEVAYTELEKIILDLEEGNQTLDDAINSFERGKLLTRHCLTILEKAELKIRNLSEENGDDGEGDR